MPKQSKVHIESSTTTDEPIIGPTHSRSIDTLPRSNESTKNVLQKILPAVGLIALLTMSTLAHESMSGIRKSARLINSSPKLQLSLTPMFTNGTDPLSSKYYQIPFYEFPDELFEPDNVETFFE